MLRIVQVPVKKANFKTISYEMYRSFSSESDGFFSRIKNTITGKGGKSAQDDQYAKQISDMANSESWTLSNFHKQVKDSSGGWKAKLPGMGSTDTVKQMKAMQALLEAAMAVAGDNASAAELKELGKKEKVSCYETLNLPYSEQRTHLSHFLTSFYQLKISIKSGADLKDINALISQFQSMDIMHRVLRYRVENGMEIPMDEDTAKTVMQRDIKKVLSPQEQKEMQRQRMKLMRRYN